MSLRSVFISVPLCLLTANAFSQITFERQHYPANNYSSAYAAADLNGDGASDLVLAQENGLGNTDGFSVYLSNGDGAFQPPVAYSIPQDGPSIGIATADVNHDGKTDIISADGSGVLVYLGNGDGTLRAPIRYQFNYGPLLAVADVNHDGNVDLVLDYNTGVSIMYGNGDGSFKNPTFVYTSTAPTTYLAVGDFDGDGNIDITTNGGYTTRGEAPVTTLTVLYGNGKGSFTPVVYDNIPEYLFVTPADVNQDGRSDLVGGFDCAAAGCGNGVQIYYGNADRTLTSVRYPTKGLSFLRSNGAIADFNGDSRLDIGLAVIEQNGDADVAVFHQSAGGAFTAKTLVPMFGSEDYVSTLQVGDFNRDNQPDLATAEQNTGSLETLLNTSKGNFPTCSPPQVSGIQVCAPGLGKTVKSPVKFNIAASSFEPIRKIEVWVDGKKLSETYFSWNLFAFSRPSLPIASGTHQADIYAGNWDGTLQHTSFSFSVK